eukprot:8674452-Lingulodinium_polyedra.AAC.1
MVRVARGCACDWSHVSCQLPRRVVDGVLAHGVAPPRGQESIPFHDVAERFQLQCGQENDCQRNAFALSLGRVGVARAMGQV